MSLKTYQGDKLFNNAQWQSIIVALLGVAVFFQGSIFYSVFERISMSRIIPVLLLITVTVALSLGLSGCGCNDSRCSFTNIPSGQP